jgi:hypothetical protein
MRFASWQALRIDHFDYSRCPPPVQLEVRIALWNQEGPVTPVGLSPTDVVEVVVDNFVFQAGDSSHLDIGGICSKDCQCGENTACLEHRCAARKTST